MEIRITIKYHFLPRKLANMKKSGNSFYTGMWVEKGVHSHIAGG